MHIVHKYINVLEKYFINLYLIIVLYIGGLWYYTDTPVEGQACVMKSTVINTSKEMMCYSDFPIPKEFPIYMHNKYVIQYFNMYAERFSLKNYIQFRTEVCLSFSDREIQIVYSYKI